ncbi:MAG: alkyl sulfatase dimerization domain-containing protein [Polyangiales bacterium]
MTKIDATRRWSTAGAGVLAVLLGLHAGACSKTQREAAPPAPTPAAAPLPVGVATDATRAAQGGVGRELPFTNREDFEDAKRGFIGTLDDPAIRNARGDVVWRLDAFDFIGENEPSPDTANPSLWRQSQLVRMHGLYQVADRIYQVRGFDLSVISFVKGDTGWIVIDPLVSAETAAAALGLVKRRVADLPVVAVIYTHSHVDHFGGVRGVVDEADVRAGRVKILAPSGFLEHAISENVIAGNAMSRRATYMYGNLLPPRANGQIGAGLGQTTSNGTVGLIPPTDTITRTGEERTIDGLKIEFLNAPGSEAPSEMMFFFPELHAFCAAEDVTHTLHNLLTMRGAQVRDPLLWAGYLEQAIEMFGDRVDVMFASHHWPRWGRARIVDMIEKQHDLYKFIHDQTMRRANQGETMHEIAEHVALPRSLSSEFFSRGYYGSLNHDVKAVYQRYIGWFDGNPATLHQHPPVEASRRYVDFMGGSDEVLRKARRSFEQGDYRWVAQVVNHVVFADPNNRAARELQAAALEQLGFQAEAGPWRNFYLTGAQELRSGIAQVPAPNTASADIISNMPLGMVWDFLAVHIDPAKAEGKRIVLGLDFTDTHETYTLRLRNSTVSYARRAPTESDARITLTRAALDDVLLGRKTMQEQLASGAIRIEGRTAALGELLDMRDTFPFWFDIVTP